MNHYFELYVNGKVDEYENAAVLKEVLPDTIKCASESEVTKVLRSLEVRGLEPYQFRVTEYAQSGSDYHLDEHLGSISGDEWLRYESVVV